MRLYAGNMCHIKDSILDQTKQIKKKPIQHAEISEKNHAHQRTQKTTLKSVVIRQTMVMFVDTDGDHRRWRKASEDEIIIMTFTDKEQKLRKEMSTHFEYIEFIVPWAIHISSNRKHSNI